MGEAAAVTHPPQQQPQHWVRHSDLRPYRAAREGQPPEPTDVEIGRDHWGKLRQAASYPLILFIRLWRMTLSRLYGDVCAFYPSCSAYGLEAVTVHGLIRGSGLTAWRILRCNPFTGGGVDHVPPAARIWPVEEVPLIVVLNHPPDPPPDSEDEDQHDDAST